MPFVKPPVAKETSPNFKLSCHVKACPVKPHDNKLAAPKLALALITPVIAICFAICPVVRVTASPAAAPVPPPAAPPNGPASPAVAKVKAGATTA